MCTDMPEGTAIAAASGHSSMLLRCMTCTTELLDLALAFEEMCGNVDICTSLHILEVPRLMQYPIMV